MIDLDEVKKASLELANRSNIAMLSTNGDEGYPNTKAMIKVRNDELTTIWFSTNTSSKRVSQLLRDPKANVYFVDTENWEGLMLVGEVEVLQDAATKERFWHPGDEKYYPLGVTDPDYTILRFNVHWGNYYHGLQNNSFKV